MPDTWRCIRAGLWLLGAEYLAIHLVDGTWEAWAVEGRHVSPHREHYTGRRLKDIQNQISARKMSTYRKQLRMFE